MQFQMSHTLGRILELVICSPCQGCKSRTDNFCSLPTQLCVTLSLPSHRKAVLSVYSLFSNSSHTSCISEMSIRRRELSILILCHFDLFQNYYIVFTSFSNFPLEISQLSILPPQIVIIHTTLLASPQTCWLVWIILTGSCERASLSCLTIGKIILLYTLEHDVGFGIKSDFSSFHFSLSRIYKKVVRKVHGILNTHHQILRCKHFTL